MCSLIASWYSVVQQHVRLPRRRASNSMGHGIILSFFEIKKASLQMPFALVIDGFMAQKTPHHCDARGTRNTLCPSTIYYDEISKKHENSPTSQNEKTWQRRFRPIRPSIYWRKTGSFAALFLVRIKNFLSDCPGKMLLALPFTIKTRCKGRRRGIHALPVLIFQGLFPF